MTELRASAPEFLVIDASLEFASSDALIQINAAYHGKTAAYGAGISPTTRRFLMHIGITHVVESIFDLAMLFPAEAHAPVQPEAPAQEQVSGSIRAPMMAVAV